MTLQPLKMQLPTYQEDLKFDGSDVAFLSHNLHNLHDESYKFT